MKCHLCPVFAYFRYADILNLLIASLSEYVFYYYGSAGVGCGNISTSSKRESSPTVSKLTFEGGAATFLHFTNLLSFFSLCPPLHSSHPKPDLC